VTRDAILSHRSLFTTGKILHRDISENNIIIADSGRLIDLDLGKELDSGLSGATHRTGTMQFMAIEVLRGKGHIYRHDLESFFYVFLWMCICYGYDLQEEGTKTKSSGELRVDKRMRLMAGSRLQRWYTGTYEEIADVKLGHMDKNRFEDIIAEFPPECEELKPLARQLRRVLFPIRDEALFTGTFQDCNIMYDGMIGAFNSAIADTPAMQLQTEGSTRNFS
jgi:serine/threonine protein kinase